MKKTWRENPLHRRYAQNTDNGDVDKATTHQWLSNSSMKGETEGFILAVQDQIFQQDCTDQEFLKTGLTSNIGYAQTTKRM